MDTPIIEEVPGGDPDLAAALVAAGLRDDDLREAGRQFFRFTDDGRLIGFVGWETGTETEVLLRSLVVVPAQRGKGWGRAMAEWALTRLAELGFTDAYMLTTSIEALALRLGFNRLERASAPAWVRQTRQFATLCPASAVLLHRSLP